MACCVVETGRSIVLVGFMGSGKSSVGRCLEHRLGLARVDTDELVTQKFGISVREIFTRYGEPTFRGAETQTLRDLVMPRPCIIVTGGGIVLKRENIDLLRRFGIIVWLDAEEQILFERAMRKGERPLLQTANPKQTFRLLLEARKPIYAAAADARIDTSNLTHDEVADLILRQIDNFTPPQK